MAAARILAIIPAYNEEATIAGTLAQLRVSLPDLDLLVINDGSRDGTSAAARAEGVAGVVDLPANLGIGGAVQTGFKYASRQGYDVAVQVDADGQHLGGEIAKLLGPVLAGEADVAIGSRFLAPGGYRSTALRRVGIGIFRLVNSLVVGQRITDNTSGFRAYNRRALAFLAEHYPTDFPEPEAVVLLDRNNFRLVEVPVAMRGRQGGSSSIGVMRAAYYMVKVLLAVVVNAFRAPVESRG
ncbi:MAG: glycosyltransferase family 2 protein [Candidatus Sericytochromatia bacterium]|nr:glycosyltransferase family 2 protein [Candidatus Tanganyikabacteria bacterium]